MVFSHYRHHRGQVMGRILHFMKHYLPYYAAEEVKVGASTVFYEGKALADFAWSERFGETDVPIFKFLDGLGERSLSLEELEAVQTAKQREAIQDTIHGNVWEDKKPVDIDLLRAIDNVRLWREPRLYSQCHDSEPEFFLATMYTAVTSTALFATLGKQTFYWHSGNGLRGDEPCWLLFSETT